MDNSEILKKNLAFIVRIAILNLIWDLVDDLFRLHETIPIIVAVFVLILFDQVVSAVIGTG